MLDTDSFENAVSLVYKEYELTQKRKEFTPNTLSCNDEWREFSWLPNGKQIRELFEACSEINANCSMQSAPSKMSLLMWKVLAAHEILKDIHLGKADRMDEFKAALVSIASSSIEWIEYLQRQHQLVLEGAQERRGD